MKQYIKEEASKNTTWYFPEYRERKTFCLRNDVYDYEILKEYEEMQCSYLQKDFKYTIKFYNKGNQLSVAKKVESELKKSTMRAFHHKSRLTSISTSSIAWLDLYLVVVKLVWKQGNGIYKVLYYIKTMNPNEMSEIIDGVYFEKLSLLLGNLQTWEKSKDDMLNELYGKAISHKLAIL